VVANHTTGSGADDAMMASKVTSNTANDGSFYAAFRLRGLRPNQERHHE
jgi:hypothetical protein